MRSKKIEVCSECDKERARCRAAGKDVHGNIIWVCNQCWRLLDYEQYLYEHHAEEQSQ